MNLQLFFERLKAERIRRGLNQDEMAEKVGVSKRSYCAYEAGDTAPSAKLLAALAGMGVGVNYILTGEHTDQVVQPFPPDEQMWLDCYRGWEMPIKRRELARALGLSSAGVSDGATPPRGDTTLQNFHGAVHGGVAGRDIVQPGKDGGKR